LIGFMGSGKTTVGICLSRRLGMRFVDIDVEIQKYEGMSINSIFEQKGEEYFREIETFVTRRVSGFENTVIATGGGSLLNPESYESLKECGVIIWLKTDLDVIKARLVQSSERPLLEIHEDIDELYRQREALYEKMDMTIDTGDLTVDQIVDEICSRLGLEY